MASEPVIWPPMGSYTESEVTDTADSRRIAAAAAALGGIPLGATQPGGIG